MTFKFSDSYCATTDPNIIWCQRCRGLNSHLPLRTRLHAEYLSAAYRLLGWKLPSYFHIGFIE